MVAPIVAAAADAVNNSIKPGDLVRSSEGEGSVVRIEGRHVIHTTPRDGGLQEVSVHWRDCHVLVSARPIKDTKEEYASGGAILLGVILAILPAVILYFVAQAFMY